MWCRATPPREAAEERPGPATVGRSPVTDPALHPFSSERELLQALGTPVVVLDAEGIVHWCNRAAEDMHGWDLSRDGGRLFSDLVPALREAGTSDVTAALSGSGTWSGRVLLTRWDGTTYPALLNCVPVHGGTGELLGLVVTSSDLTEVEGAARRLSGGFDSSPFGWMFCELDGTIADCNQSCADIIGRERHDVLGRRPDDFTHPADADTPMPFEAMRSGSHPPVFRSQMRYVRPDGTTRWVRVHARLVTDHLGQPELFYVHLEDITALLGSTEAREAAERSYHELFGRAVHSLGAALEARDAYTAGHQHRVAELCVAIARRLGMSEDATEGLAICAEVHDIGKVATPAEILTKPGRLFDVEYDVIKLHSQIGSGILQEIPFPWPVARAVREHHERLDGSGYPDGLTGDALCLEARVIAVADTVESVASHRPYRLSRSLETALEIVTDNAGILYDPEVVAACTAEFDSGFTLPGHPAPLLEDNWAGGDVRA